MLLKCDYYLWLFVSANRDSASLGTIADIHMTFHCQCPCQWRRPRRKEHHWEVWRRTRSSVVGSDNPPRIGNFVCWFLCNRVPIKFTLLLYIRRVLRNMGGAHKMDVHACSWVLLFVAVLYVVPEATGLIGKERRRYISYMA